MTDATTVFDRVCADLGYAESPSLHRREANGDILTGARPGLHGVDALFSVEGRPSVAFAIRDTMDAVARAALHQRVWSDGRIPVLMCISTESIHVYNGLDAPARQADGLDAGKRLLASLRTTVTALDALAPFSRQQLESGALWRSPLGETIRSGIRCERSLLANLRSVRKRLIADHVPRDAAHRLLLRLIFVLYLEHRGVLTPAGYAKLGCAEQRLLDVMNSRDKMYDLFTALSGEINGDLLPVEQSERDHVKQEHVVTLQRFLAGRERAGSSQLWLWPLYDFSAIPIHVISAIYEMFLHTDNADGDRAEGQGEHYTPPALASLVVDEVWPKPDKRATSLPTVLDPACGSGVFLIEAWYRLVAEAKARADRPLSATELRSLMVEHLFGIDKNADAVRITAFSLYLALLDQIEPRDVIPGFKLPPLTSADPVAPCNLLAHDAFGARWHLGRTYDVVVGNPPWHRGRLPETVRRYVGTRAAAEELAHAFIWLAVDVCRGQAALVCTARWMFNEEKPDAEFRRQFLLSTEVVTVLNLARLRAPARAVDALFSGAIGAASVVVFKSPRSSTLSPSILYASPMPSNALAPGQPFVIEGPDVRWLPRDEAEQGDGLWKTLMWGGWRDVALLRRMARGRTLKEVLKDHQCGSARGYQLGTTRSDPWLAAQCVIDTADLHGYTALPSTTPGDPGRRFSWTGPSPELYQKPHVLYCRYARGERFEATYVPADCGFDDDIVGVWGPPESESLLKALAVYLSSDIANYLLFFAAGEWGVDKERVTKGHVFGLPGTPLEDPRVVEELAQLVDEAARCGSDAKLRAAAEEIVGKSFRLQPGERQLIRDLRWRLDHPPGSRDPTASPETLLVYARSLVETLSNVSRKDWRAVAWPVAPSSPLRVVVLARPGHSPPSLPSSDPEVDAALAVLDSRLLSSRGESLYVRRHLRLYEQDAIYLIKPAAARWWLPSAAMSDADDLVAEILAGAADGDRR